MKKVIKLAYDLNGNSVPYNSKDVNVKIRIHGRSIQAEHHGLPRIWYNYYGGM